MSRLAPMVHWLFDLPSFPEQKWKIVHREIPVWSFLTGYVDHYYKAKLLKHRPNQPG